jgi:hypothetical protein
MPVKPYLNTYPLIMAILAQRIEKVKLAAFAGW